MLETLLQLRRKIKTIVVPRNNGGGLADPSLKLVMKQIGFDDVREIEEAEVIKFGEIEIIGLPFLGEHADLNIRSKTAYALRVGGNVIVCAADTCRNDGIRE